MNEWWYRLITQSFPFWQALGIHVVPNHFDQPVPDTRDLPNGLWEKLSELPGINLNEQRQLDLLAQFQSQYRAEYESFPRNKTDIPHQYYVNNGMFESVDGEILYCMIRHFRPKKIVEVGSGNSTCLSAQALLKNKEQFGEAGTLIAIEPYPSKVLRTGYPGLSRLIASRIQDVPLSQFLELEANDVLFLDSSHVLQIGSDVEYEYLEIIPRLKNGVFVHAHDIFLPAQYPKAWVLKQRRFFTEQYLVQALLAFNRAFEVLWAGSFMHLRHAELLEAAFSSYSRLQRWPGSFWMRKTE